MSQAKLNCNRRGFLQIGTAGLAGLSLAGLMQRRAMADSSAPPRAKNVILVLLAGGPATIDMWDMKPDASEIVRGEFQPIDTTIPGVQICEHLPKLAQAMNRVALVRSLTHTIAEHTQGVAYLMSGNRPTPALAYPSLGSLCAKLSTPTPGTPSYFSVGQQPGSGAGYLGAGYDPLVVSPAGASATPGDEGASQGSLTSIRLPEGFTAADLERRRALLERLDARMATAEGNAVLAQLGEFSAQAIEILRSDRIHAALDVEREPAAIRDRYGRSAFARSMLAARRLVEAGARFVTVGLDDWDTHTNNFTRLRGTLLPQLDGGLAALIDDLRERGLLEETVVYCTGEFGRTPSVNANAGRDHWARTMTALVAGGGFKPGHVHGATDDESYEPSESPCSPDDLSATIFRQLGFPPDQTLLTPTGRPVQLFRHGRPLDALLS